VAGAAASALCSANLWNILGKEKHSLPISTCSPLVFIRRAKGLNVCDRCIPTPHLVSIFEESQLNLQNIDSMKLFQALSSHSFTRTAAGWIYEIQVHKYLSGNHTALKLFRGVTEGSLRPSTRLLPGTLTGLGDSGVDDSFYWVPSTSNFPGIDSVLGDEGGNLYAIQVTIAEHLKWGLKRDGQNSLRRFGLAALGTSSLSHLHKARLINMCSVQAFSEDL